MENMLTSIDATSSQVFSNISAQTTGAATNIDNCQYSCTVFDDVVDFMWSPSIYTITVATAFTTFGSNSSISISSVTYRVPPFTLSPDSPFETTTIIGSTTTIDSFTMYLYCLTNKHICNFLMKF